MAREPLSSKGTKRAWLHRVKQQFSPLKASYLLSCLTGLFLACCWQPFASACAHKRPSLNGKYYQPLVQDLLFKTADKWQAKGLASGIQMCNSLRLKHILNQAITLKDARTLISWREQLNRDEFTAFVPVLQKYLAGKGKLSPKPILTATCRPVQPAFLTYILEGKKRYLYLPPADKAYQVYIPIDIAEDPDLKSLRLHTLTPKCICKKKIVYCLTLLSCPTKSQEQIRAACLFEDRIFFPHNINFSFPVGQLPLGDRINSSFYMSNLDQENERNEVSPTLFLPPGITLNTTLRIPKDARLYLEWTALPFLAFSSISCSLQVFIQKKLAVKETKLFDLSQHRTKQGFTKKEIDLSAYAGQTVKIVLESNTANQASTQSAIQPLSFILIRNLQISGLAIKSAQQHTDRPNILIIVPDSLRADTAYAPELLTPDKGLQKIMHWPDTITFTRAYSPSNTTTPSTNCLLHAKFLREFPDYFYPAQDNNLFNWLQKQGYRTYCLTTNPYLIPKLEFFTNKYIFYRNLMDGDRLFDEALHILRTKDQDRRPAAIFIQAMETHSPDDFRMIKKDLLKKPTLAKQLAYFLGARQIDTPSTLYKKLDTSLEEMNFALYKPISSPARFDQKNLTLQFKDATRLALSFNPYPLHLSTLKDDIERIEFILECSSPDLREKVKSGNIELFLADRKNQLYQISSPSHRSAKQLKITLDLNSCRTGGPAHRRFPLEDYQGLGILQLHFKTPSQGIIRLKHVSICHDSPWFKKILRKLKEKSARKVTMPAQGVFQGNVFLPPPSLYAHRLAYRAKMIYFDCKLEAFLQALQQDQISPALFYFADHGQSLGEHGLYGHGSGLYNQQIHVPLLVHVPGRLQGKILQIDTPSQTLNLYQTVRDILHKKAAQDLRGRSLLTCTRPTTGESEIIPPPWVLSHIDPRNPHEKIALTRADLKIIVDLQSHGLLTLANTRTEDRIPFPRGLKQAVARMISLYQKLGDKHPQGKQSKRLDILLDLNKNRLKDLGYLD